MVYIPPMKDHQYSQYGDREIKKQEKGHDPFHLIPVNRISPLKNGEQYHLTAKGVHEGKAIKVKKSSIKKARNKKYNERVYRELTGKGVNFDVTI